MKPHLTQPQFADCLLAAPAPGAAAHLANCPACANELERTRAALAGFRDATRAWSEMSETSEAAGDRSHAKRPPTPAWRWGLRLAPWAVAAALLLALAPGLHPPAPPALADSAAQIARDNQLLASINQDLSESVPAAMQPLALANTSTRTQP